MKFTSFLVKKDNNEKGIEGVFIQFNNGNARITFEELLHSESYDVIFELQQKGHIQNIGNFIASFVQRIAPDYYHNITIDGKNTKILNKNDINAKRTRIIYRANGYDFENTEQTVIDINGNEVLLNDLIAFEKIEIPKNYNYTKNTVLNNILVHNNVPFDVDRKFISVLSSSIYEIFDEMKKRGTNSIIVSLSKHAKKEFTVYKNYPEKKMKTHLYLEVKYSHFNLYKWI